MITLTHSLGRKGSLFLQEWVQCQFNLIHKTPKFMVDDHSVIFEF